MINTTVLVGRLVSYPELRYTGSGIAVTSATVAVERSYSNAQGERGERNRFHQHSSLEKDGRDDS